ncbi:MAG: 3-dehydroquinate synthase [Christensenellaceae bacterium]
MKTVKVYAQNGNYDILIGNEILSESYFSQYHKYMVITDENVYPLYKQHFKNAQFIVLKAGEQSKSIENLSLIYNKMMEYELDRKDCVVALGGGVVGDIAGFAAATFKRGIDFVQIPTTLLAQVDSSVGGKVAINLQGGKNMVGAFYQPKRVIADIATLQTLDQRQYAAGMAEVIKYAYISDEKLHRTLKQSKIDNAEIVAQCCKIKAKFVAEDPYDTGVRMKLNYGHTIGHAIETTAGYGFFLHGEAIAIGMVYAAMIGEKLNISPKNLSDDTIELLKKYQLPYEIDKTLLIESLEILSADKKTEGTKINLILIDEIGSSIIKKIEIETIKQILKEYCL